jgi:hypothetical protein
VPLTPLNLLGLTVERAWFRHEAMLGAIIYDLSDDTWAFVALAKDTLGNYRCFDVGASFPTSNAAVNGLLRVFKKNEGLTIPQGDDAEHAEWLAALPPEAFGQE